MGIIHLGRDYETERVEAAAKRALKFNTCSYRSMKAILSTGLDQQPDSLEQRSGPDEPAVASKHSRTGILPIIKNEEENPA